MPICHLVQFNSALKHLCSWTSLVGDCLPRRVLPTSSSPTQKIIPTKLREMMVFRFHFSFKPSRPTVIESRKNSLFILFQHLFQICCPPEKPCEAIIRSSLNVEVSRWGKRCTQRPNSLAHWCSRKSSETVWFIRFLVNVSSWKKPCFWVQASQTCEK